VTTTRHNRIPPIVTVAIVAVGAAALARAAGSDPPSDRAVNPHWAADGCKYCHDPAQGEPKAIPPERIDGLCLHCHDGQRARREAHPVGRTFVGDQIVRPEGWPAYDGKLGCATCHDIHRACDPRRARPADNPVFVRDYRVGQLLTFCAHCHLDLPQQRPYNVHIMLDPNDQTIRRACQFCHHSLLDERDRRVRLGQPELRYEPITLCRSCHMGHVDYFEPGHIGAKVPADMKAYMAAFEQNPVGSRPDGSQIEDARQRGLVPKRLPLGEADTLVCSTCHNPHQQGVFPPNSVLAYGAIQTGQEQTKLRLRGLGKEFCLACHNK
jgi:predicted CXXCH cytochrome family protein